MTIIRTRTKTSCGETTSSCIKSQVNVSAFISELCIPIVLNQPQRSIPRDNTASLTHHLLPSIADLSNIKAASHHSFINFTHHGV